MKKLFFAEIIFALSLWSVGASAEQNILGCLDCFNFTAPAISGAENVSTPQIGLIVMDTYYGGFRGFTSAGTWQRLSNDKYVRTLTSNTTLVASDDVVLSNATSSAFSVTLPSAATYPGKILSVKKVDSSANQITINPVSAQTIDGATSKKVYFQNDVTQIVSDGANWQDITQRGFHPPTISTVTTTSHTGSFSANSSGTYSPPAGTLYIRVRMVGGGGGGAGSGSTAGTAAGDGIASTFGTSLISASGGSHGPSQSGSGGSGGNSSLGSGPVGINLSGGSGGGGQLNGNTTTAPSGGLGGASAFGGGGTGGGYNTAGSGGAAFTGGGGGGAGIDRSTGADRYTGSGGGAGGFVDAIISSPLSSYNYQVGAGGSAGTAGTSGLAGGAGGSGFIEVTEYYQ